MVDIVSITESNVSDWNDEEKCGYCWEFTAPIRQSDLNEYQFRGEGCCVLVAITDYRWSCTPGYDRLTGLPNLGYSLYDFNLHFLMAGDVGLNVHNEIPDHPTNESKWATILEPLMQCVGCKPLDFCTSLGYNLEVTRWSAQPRLDWMDMNYDGWSIQVQLRENNTI